MRLHPELQVSQFRCHTKMNEPAHFSRFAISIALRTPPCSSPRFSPLLCLPRELRDYLYDTLFVGSCFQFEQLDLITVLSYDGSTSESRRLPSWLLTNKQILHEGLEQFYRQARGIACRHRTAQNDLENVFRQKSGNKPERPSQRQLIEYPRILMPLHRVRSISITDLELRYYAAFTYTQPRPAPRTVYISSLHMVHPLRRWISAQRGSLKTLKLAFRRPVFFVHPTELEDWQIDLSQIEPIATLESVEFAILSSGEKPTTTEMAFTSTTTCILELVQQELERVAIAWVDPTSKGCVTKRWVTGEEEGGDQAKAAWEYEWHVDARRDIKRRSGKECGD